MTQLIAIIKGYNIYDACQKQINILNDSFENLQIYIENFSNNITTATKQELYKFQNQLQQNNLDISQLKNIFYKKKVNRNKFYILFNVMHCYNVMKLHLSE